MKRSFPALLVVALLVPCAARAEVASKKVDELKKQLGEKWDELLGNKK